MISYTGTRTELAVSLKKAIQPFAEAAKGALEFGNLTEHSDFVLSTPSGALRTQKRMSMNDLRDIILALEIVESLS